MTDQDHTDVAVQDDIRFVDVFDGESLLTPEILCAIEACASDPGTRILTPFGRFVIRPLGAADHGEHELVDLDAEEGRDASTMNGYESWDGAIEIGTPEALACELRREIGERAERMLQSIDAIHALARSVGYASIDTVEQALRDPEVSFPAVMNAISDERVHILRAHGRVHETERCIRIRLETRYGRFVVGHARGQGGMVLQGWDAYRDHDILAHASSIEDAAEAFAEIMRERAQEEDRRARITGLIRTASGPARDAVPAPRAPLVAIRTTRPEPIHRI